MHIAQEIEDRYQIEQALRRYCRGVDRGDAELIRSAYHDDAFDDHGEFKGSAKDFAARLIAGTQDRWLSAQHLLHQTNIDFADQVAWVETYFTAHHKVSGQASAGGSHSVGDDRPDQGASNSGVVLESFGGRYADRFEKRNGAWAIARRVVICDWSRVQDIAREYPSTGFEQGKRSKEDMSYQRID